MNIKLTICNLCARAAMLLLATVISIGAQAQTIGEITISGVESKLLINESRYSFMYTLSWDYYAPLEEYDESTGDGNYIVEIKYKDTDVDPRLGENPSIIKNGNTLYVNIEKFSPYTLVNYTLTIKSIDKEDKTTKTVYFSAMKTDRSSSESTPFVINTKDELRLLRDAVNGGITFEGQFFRLDENLTFDNNDDIDPNDKSNTNYIPIGGYHYDDYRDFCGQFDGDGHTISGICIDNEGTTGYVGLFGRLGSGAVVKNITLDNADITGPECTGSIAGTNVGGTITNCHVNSNVTIYATNTEVQTNNYHGGIVGLNGGGIVSYCSSGATLSNSNEVTSKGKWNNYGAIAGDNKSTLSHNVAIGATIPYADGKYYGAIVGQNESSGSLDHNYYADCTKKDDKDIGGCNGADATDQAEPATILTDTKGLSLQKPLSGKVVYFRAFRYGEPSTIILPFVPIPTENVDKFYTFKGVEKDGNYYKAIMEESTSLNYNTPYIYKAVKPNNETESFRLAFYVHNFESSTSIVEVGSTTPTEDTHWTFKGSYSEILWEALSPGQKRNVYGFAGQAVSDTEDSSKSIEAGEFVRIGEYVRLRPQRCYMEYTPTSSTRAGSLTDEELPETIRVILVDDGGKTDIGSLSPKTGIITFDSDAWYSLDGKRFSTQPAQKGIYVNNGKKVVIK